MGMFGTKLSAKDETCYQGWRSHLPSDLQNEGDYDLRGAWQGNAQEAANGHLPDTYKLPNHITFSTGSQYSTPQTPGGEWIDAGNDRWAFWASPYNLQQHSGSELGSYFNQYEPNSAVVLPIGYKLTAGQKGGR